MSAPGILIRDALAAWGTQSSPTDKQYRAGGQWIQDGPQLPAYTQGGPGAAAAALWRETGAWADYQTAIQSIGWMLTTNQKSTGEIVDGITTMFFCQELGTAYLLLEPEPHFIAEQADWWKQALTKAADYLIAAGHVVWYANGNINLGYTLVLYLAARITGQARFAAAYQQSLWFTQFPPHPWEALGLQLTARPTTAAAADGAGYFTENGGFDGEYSGVQLDVLTRLWVLSGDPVVERLLRLVYASVMAKVDTTTWMLDSGGTRHAAGRLVDFTSPAHDILGGPSSHWAAIDATFRRQFAVSNPNYYRQLSSQVGVFILAGAVPRV